MKSGGGNLLRKFCQKAEWQQNRHKATNTTGNIEQLKHKKPAKIIAQTPKSQIIQANSSQLQTESLGTSLTCAKALSHNKSEQSLVPRKKVKYINSFVQTYAFHLNKLYQKILFVKFNWA